MYLLRGGSWCGIQQKWLSSIYNEINFFDIFGWETETIFTKLPNIALQKMFRIWEFCPAAGGTWLHIFFFCQSPLVSTGSFCCLLCRSSSFFSFFSNVRKLTQWKRKRRRTIITCVWNNPEIIKESPDICFSFADARNKFKSPVKNALISARQCGKKEEGFFFSFSWSATISAFLYAFFYRGKQWNCIPLRFLFYFFLCGTTVPQKPIVHGGGTTPILPTDAITIGHHQLMDAPGFLREREVRWAKKLLATTEPSSQVILLITTPHRPDGAARNLIFAVGAVFSEKKLFFGHPLLPNTFPRKLVVLRNSAGALPAYNNNTTFFLLLGGQSRFHYTLCCRNKIL